MANVWRNPVGVCPHALESGPPAEPAEGVLDRDRGERPPVAGEEDVIDIAPYRPVKLRAPKAGFNLGGRSWTEAATLGERPVVGHWTAVALLDAR